MIDIPTNLYGADMIRYCYNQTVQSGLYYFALQAGHLCASGSEYNRFDRYGASYDCTSPCGNEPTPSGSICGGINANSVYQVEVNNVHLS